MDKTANAFRIYEYIDSDGVIFWSFTRLPGTSIRKMILTEHRGTFFRRHIQDIQDLARQHKTLETEDGD